MGLGDAASTGMWAPMILPSAVPFTPVYARIVGRPRPLRLTAFVAGYLAVWTASALPAYGLRRTELPGADSAMTRRDRPVCRPPA